jgi:hypothetical protein
MLLLCFPEFYSTIKLGNAVIVSTASCMQAYRGNFLNNLFRNQVLYLMINGFKKYI